ncbi:MAG: FIST C-terminal domain-containing protein [Polyangiaceae bacterium]|nr:FIST C-terminal domain-containing protein [Polyangiaceae bacterium]
MSASPLLSVRTGATSARDVETAARDLARQIAQPAAAATIVFASPVYDLAALGPALVRRFPGLLVGCTTAGEITPRGYATGTLAGFSVASAAFEAHAISLSPLAAASRDAVEASLTVARRTLEEARQRRPSASAFGLLLVDGLSIMEEQVAAVLATALGDLPLVGGSAGDGLDFRNTYVLANGTFVKDAAALLLCVTTLPFTVFKTQHFTAGEQRVVITRASPARRLVHEINGRPAAAEYARLVGVTPEDLGPELFSNHPLMLRFGGEYYVRSIQRAHEDGALTFFCAIDEGVVLRLARGENLVENLAEALATAGRRVPRPALTIGCDCILRRVEIMTKDLTGAVDALLTAYHVIGFSTYGEQFGSLHVNQTFTGIMLGEGGG